MLEKIKELLAIMKNDKYVIDNKKVAEITGRGVTAVNLSRRDAGAMLDKLAAFEMIKELVEVDDADVLTGGKDGIVAGLSVMLEDDTRYEVTFRKV